MSDDMTTAKRSRAALVGDACLLTAAAFCLLSGVAGALQGLLGGAPPLETGPPPGAMGVVVQLVGSVLMVASLVVGPGAAWLLHGRRIGVAAVLGAGLGVIAGLLALQGIFLLAMLVGMAMERITGAELAGPIAILVIVSAAFLGLVVTLDVDAVRDLSPARREHRRLDIFRIVATVVVVVFSTGVIWLGVAYPKTEIGEAGIFALAFAVFGAVVVAVADTVTTFVEKRAARAGSGADAGA